MLLLRATCGSGREFQLQPWRTGWSSNTSGGTGIVVTTTLYQMPITSQLLRSERHVQPCTGSCALKNKQDPGMWKWGRTGILVGRLQNRVHAWSPGEAAVTQSWDRAVFGSDRQCENTDSTPHLRPGPCAQPAIHPPSSQRELLLSTSVPGPVELSHAFRPVPSGEDTG